VGGPGTAGGANVVAAAVQTHRKWRGTAEEEETPSAKVAWKNGRQYADCRNSGTTVTLRVASIQFRAIPANKAENMRCLSDLVGEAALNGARIIVLPEMCTTGLNIQYRAQAEILAEIIPGPTSNAFAELALRNKVYIVLGLAESDPTAGKLYNSQIILDPAGLIIGRYRKIHTFGPDLNWADIGNLGYQAVTTEWGRIGLGICCDINYWELIGFLSGAQVGIFAFSTNWVGEELPFPYWTEMLAGCSFYLIAANNWGDEGDIHFSGGSTILAPDLTVLAQSRRSANNVVYADINLES
jgi:predicted amidohydrolase